jgi:hypothetical protein
LWGIERIEQIFDILSPYAPLAAIRRLLDFDKAVRKVASTPKVPLPGRRIEV